MMATDERDALDWNQAESERGTLLSSFPGIGGEAATAGRRGEAADKNSRAQAPRSKMNMCGLLSLQFYRPYFDVDTSQVKGRLLQAAWPMRQTSPFLDQMETEGGDDNGAPDLYGPVWVSATLIFALSVVTNARRGVDAGEFEEVSTSAYSVLAYLVIGSAGLWAFFRAHAVPLSLAEALSVYGYSLTPFLATAPLGILSWPFRWCGLAAASIVAAIFVLRSAWPRLQEHMPEKSMVLLLTAVAAYHCLWFFLLLVV